MQHYFGANVELALSIAAEVCNVTPASACSPKALQPTWVVVKIMVLLWIPMIIRHLIFRVPKREHNFDFHLHVLSGGFVTFHESFSEQSIYNPVNGPPEPQSIPGVPKGPPCACGEAYVNYSVNFFKGGLYRGSYREALSG